MLRPLLRSLEKPFPVTPSTNRKPRGAPTRQPSRALVTGSSKNWMPKTRNIINIPARIFMIWVKMVCLPHCCAHSLWKRR